MTLSARKISLRPPLGGGTALPTKTLLAPNGLEEKQQLHQIYQAVQNGSPPAIERLSRCFQELFRREGKVVTDFANYLLDKHLVHPRKPTCLVFLQNGATPLQKLTEALATTEQQGRIIGLLLQKPMVEQRSNQPLVVKTLFEASLLGFAKIVFVDTGYHGSIGRAVAYMLNDDRLLRFVEEEYQLVLPRREWEIKVELLCLRDKHRLRPGDNIEGYNYVAGRAKDPIFDQLAYLVDEGMSPCGKRSAGAVDRELLTRALIHASRAVTL